MGHRDLDVLDAARSAAAEVNHLIDSTPEFLHRVQLRDSVQSIPANISEGFTRPPGPWRTQFLRVSMGSARESVEHLSSNFEAGRISGKQFWRLTNRLVTISKMLDSLIRRMT
jgi:four helix bundle protein